MIRHLHLEGVVRLVDLSASDPKMPAAVDGIADITPSHTGATLRS